MGLIRMCSKCGKFGRITLHSGQQLISMQQFLFQCLPFPLALCFLSSCHTCHLLFSLFFTAVFLQQNREEKRCPLMQMGKRKHSETYCHGSCPRPTFASFSTLKKGEMFVAYLSVSLHMPVLNTLPPLSPTLSKRAVAQQLVSFNSLVLQDPVSCTMGIESAFLLPGASLYFLITKFFKRKGDQMRRPTHLKKPNAILTSNYPHSCCSVLLPTLLSC